MTLPKQSKLLDGPMGLVYIWNLDNGYTFSCISLYTHFQKIYKAKYEMFIMDSHGNSIEGSNVEKFTSSVAILERTLEYAKSL